MSMISHHIQEFQMFKNGLQFLVHPVNMCLFTSFKIKYFFALRVVHTFFHLPTRIS